MSNINRPEEDVALDKIEGEPKKRQRYTEMAWRNYWAGKDAMRLPICKLMCAGGYLIKIEKIAISSTMVQIASVAGGGVWVQMGDHQVAELIEALLA